MSTQAEQNSTPTRDSLRAHALKSRKPNKQIVQYDGNEYEIRQPTVGDRTSMLRRCMIGEGSSQSIDPLLTLVWATIYCTYVPGTDIKVFEEADFDGLCNGTAGNSICDVLGEKILPLVNLQSNEVMEGNSDAIPSAD